MTFTSSEIDEVDSTAHTLLVASFWIDWWMYAAWSLILERYDDEAECYDLFLAGA